MMRAWLVFLALVVGTWLLLASPRASVAPAADRAGAATQRSSSARTWRLTLSPAPDDLTLAEIHFPGSSWEQLSDRTLQVAVSGPFGADYLAVAVPRFRTQGGSLALVLLVNRPSPLLDPVSVQLQLSAAHSLAAPRTWKLSDPITHSDHAAGSARCGLSAGGSALSGSRLSPLRSRGKPLTGFSPAAAVAQAYDVACGLPYASSFKQAVQQLASGPEPPSAPESPSEPPVGKVPGEGCQPRPGYACPGAVRVTVPASAADGGLRAAGGAH